MSDRGISCTKYCDISHPGPQVSMNYVCHFLRCTEKGTYFFNSIHGSREHLSNNLKLQFLCWAPLPGILSSSTWYVELIYLLHWAHLPVTLSSSICYVELIYLLHWDHLPVMLRSSICWNSAWVPFKDTWPLFPFYALSYTVLTIFFSLKVHVWWMHVVALAIFFNGFQAISWWFAWAMLDAYSLCMYIYVWNELWQQVHICALQSITIMIIIFINCFIIIFINQLAKYVCFCFWIIYLGFWNCRIALRNVWKYKWKSGRYSSRNMYRSLSANCFSVWKMNCITKQHGSHGKTVSLNSKMKEYA